MAPRPRTKNVMASCIDRSICWPRPVRSFCAQAASTATAAYTPAPASPIDPGIIGGPWGSPLIENAPAAACAIGCWTAKPAYGPRLPNPLMRA